MAKHKRRNPDRFCPRCSYKLSGRGTRIDPGESDNDGKLLWFTASCNDCGYDLYRWKQRAAKPLPVYKRKAETSKP